MSTLINLPPPPTSDPVTPSEPPSRSGTPNSTTTSMSELSTVAIKDGHRGHLPHGHAAHAQYPSSSASFGISHQLDAERADRISRLAGLERVTTARNPGFTPPALGNLTPGASASAAAAAAASASTSVSAAPHHLPAPLSYFDASGTPILARERSTVGSASATGSVGARTTWAGSEPGDIDAAFDRMSESQDLDMDASSVGGLSDEGTPSLVAFGEGARTPARQSVLGSPAAATTTTPTTTAVDPRRSAFTSLPHPPTSTSAAAAPDPPDGLVREHMNTTSADRMRSGPAAAAAAAAEFGFGPK